MSYSKERNLFYGEAMSRMSLLNNFRNCRLQNAHAFLIMYLDYQNPMTVYRIETYAYIQ